MAIVGTLTVLMGMNNAPLMAGIASSQAAMTGMAGSATASAALVRSALLGIGAGAVVGMGLAVNAARDFQEQMATVNTVARLAPDALTAIGSEVQALSAATGVGLPDLTQGLYDLVSAGVPAGQAMEFLRNATTLSIGGLSSASEAVDIITTGVNAWSVAQGSANLTLADSGVVMDVFAKSIELGKLTAQDIAGSIANVASQAAALNIPIQEVGATYATLTARGIPAAEATTMLNAALISLQRIPPGMQKLQDATGKSYETIARTQGAQAAMAALVTDAQKYNVALIDVFGRQEGMAFALNVTGAAAGAYRANLTAMYNSTGTASEQAAERMATLDRQLAVLGASLINLGITLGTALLPPLTTFTQTVSGAVQSISAWAAANPALSSSLLPLVAAVSALGLGVALLGAPFVAIIAIITLVALNMDALARGVQVVIDTITRMIELAKIGADAVMSIPGVKGAADVVGYGGQVAGAAARAQGGNLGPTIEAATFMAQFEAQNGRRATPLDFAAWQRGGSQPIQINNNTTVVLDGQKVGEVTDRRLYNNASQASSGFNRGALEY